jgi:transposase
MDVTLTAPQMAELEAAVLAEQDVRRWKRYQAVLLLAEGGAPVRVAHALHCSRASVYGWAARWRAQGVAGLHEGDHGGGKAKLDAAGEAALTTLLATDPQARGHRATGWTVPLLRDELAQAGYSVADRTIRRALHRLGYRWKRPRYVLGRPDPAYEAKKGG